MRIQYPTFAIFVFVLVSRVVLISSELRCWKCASVEQRKCPENAVIVLATQGFNACVTWRLGNGTVILQNVVKYEEECTRSKVAFWSKFINMYYGGDEINSATVECCRDSGCNSGNKKQEILYPGPPLESPSSLSLSPIVPRTQHYIPDVLRRMDGTPSYRVPFSPYPFSSDAYDNFLQTSAMHNPIKEALAKATKNQCQKYFSSSSGEEWVPKNLVPLTLDRASEAKVSVFFSKFNSLQNNNDHVIVRVLDESKTNKTMYTFKLYNVGSVSLFVSEYKNDREEEIRQTSSNNVIKLTDEDYHGFWVSIRNEEISLGKIGDTLVHPVIIWNDTYSKGPRNPSFIGITTPKSSSASFGAGCESSNLHYEDTCITDEDCVKYPKTVCRKEPLEPKLDQGGRDKPFDEWDSRSSILKACFCEKGHIRIRDSKGCYDPIRSVITLKEACFSDHHCQSLPNTVCKSDYQVPQYNHSCQCLMGHKPFNPDPKTGLIEGCSLLTEEEKLTIHGCLEKFKIDTAERVPERINDFRYDEESKAYIAVVQIKFDLGVFDKSAKNPKGYSDVAVVKMLNEYKSGDKMLSVSFDRSDGRITIEDTLRSRGFFFENDYTREKTGIDDVKILKRMEKEYVGFWIMYSYKEDFGGTLSVGLVGFPMTVENSLLSWTDSSDSVMEKPRYLGFTSENEGSSIYFGTNCVIKKNPPVPSTLLDGSSTLGRIKSQHINPWLAHSSSILNDEGTLSNWQHNAGSYSDPLLQQQYFEKLSKILPQYYEDDKTLHAQSLYRDIEPLKGSLA